MQTVKTPTVKLQASPRVKLGIRAGLNDRGKQSRSYVQQITGKNVDKTPTKTAKGMVVYDWVIVNAGKPGANFEKLGRTGADTEGHFENRFVLGDGVYRVVRPNETYTGWPETIFLKVHAGKTERIDQNAARAAFGLPPVVIAAKAAAHLPDDDDEVISV